MSSRYTKLFSKNSELYASGSPITVSAYALLQDSETDLLIAQIKLRSISDKEIKGVKVKLLCFDADNNQIGDEIEYEYTNISVSRNGYFGESKPIILKDKRIHSFLPDVYAVNFKDGSEWNSESEKWEPLPSCEKINHILISGVKYGGKEMCLYAPKEYKDLWICACGHINHKEEEACSHCERRLQDIINVEEDALVKRHLYEEAVKLSESQLEGDIIKASQIFKELGDYKDAAKRLEKLSPKANKAIKNKKRKLAAIICGSVAAAFLLTWFVIAPLLSLATGRYTAYVKIYNIKELEIRDGIEEIRDDAFMGCDSLESVEIPDSVKRIGNSAFSNCTNLKKVEIPDSVKKIGNYAFGECHSLSEIILPDDIESIEPWTFAYCYSLESIEIPDSVKSIGNCAFRNCGFKEFTFPDGIQIIDDGVFGWCSNLEKIDIPDGVTSIGDYAFHNCTSLKGILIPESVASIGTDAFYLCSSLDILVMFDGVKKIGDRAFDGCPIKTAIVPEIACPYISGSDALDTVIVGSGTKIRGETFRNSKVKTVMIPNTVTSIDTRAFYNCTGLTKIIIPDSVTFIGDSAFGYCTSLERIIIPDSETYMGDRLFEGCSNLKEVYYKGNEADWSDDLPSNATIYYYSVNEPSRSGNYWHYDSNGNAVIW